MKDFIEESMQGKTIVANEAKHLSMSESDINCLFKMFLLLYANGTVFVLV